MKLYKYTFEISLLAILISSVALGINIGIIVEDQYGWETMHDFKNQKNIDNGTLIYTI